MTLQKHDRYTGETGFLNRTIMLGETQYRYQVFVPADFTPDQRWPVILYLHGAGEGGSDGLLQTEVGLGHAIRCNVAKFPVIAVFPQAPHGHPWRGAMAELALQALEKAIDEFSGDRSRIYLTGISMGGYGSWRMALENPGKFAALVPICGGLDVCYRGRVSLDAGEDCEPSESILKTAESLRDLPVWVFHGEGDPIIPVSESRVIVTALQQVRANVRYTEYLGVEHDSWDPAYAEPQLMPWLLSQRRDS